MELAFASLELRSLCEDPERDEQLSPQAASALVQTLADMRAAPSIGDLPPIRGLMVEDEGRVVFPLADSHRAVLRVNHKRLPLDGVGRPVWERVRRVQVLSIEAVP